MEEPGSTSAGSHFTREPVGLMEPLLVNDSCDCERMDLFMNRRSNRTLGAMAASSDPFQRAISNRTRKRTPATRRGPLITSRKAGAIFSSNSLGYTTTRQMKPNSRLALASI